MRNRGFEKVSYASDEEVTLPTRSTSNSAGYDFYSPVTFTIQPHCVEEISTGVKAYMQADEVLLINVRSSIGIKKGLQLTNTQAVIDSDFYNSAETEGNIKIGLRNLTDTAVTIQKGERIVQGIFVKYLITDNDNPLSDTRIGGIGSTGK